MEQTQTSHPEKKTSPSRKTIAEFLRKQKVTMLFLLIIGSMLLALYLVQPDGAQFKGELDMGGNLSMDLPNSDGEIFGGEDMGSYSSATGSIFSDTIDSGTYPAADEGLGNEYVPVHDTFLEELNNSAIMNASNPTVPEEAQETKTGPELYILLIVSLSIGAIYSILSLSRRTS